MRKSVTLGLGLASVLAFSPVIANAAGYTMTTKEKKCVEDYEDLQSSLDDSLITDHYGSKNSLFCECWDKNEVFTVSNAIDIDPTENVTITSESSNKKAVSVYVGKKVKTVKRVKRNGGYKYNVTVKRLKNSKNVSRLVLTCKNEQSLDKYDKFNLYDAAGKKLGSFEFGQVLTDGKTNGWHVDEKATETIDIDW